MKYPKDNKITGRSSTIRGTFIKAIIPTISATDKEKSDCLKKLKQVKDNFFCSYCGIPATEWDHFRSIVFDKKPTGYVTDIYNLVPSCGKCNQSKSGANWKTWMKNEKAIHSPIKKLSLDELNKKIAILENFEQWSDKYVTKMPKSFLDSEIFAEYLESCEKLIKTFTAFQEKAEAIKMELLRCNNTKN